MSDLRKRFDEWKKENQGSCMACAFVNKPSWEEPCSKCKHLNSNIFKESKWRAKACCNCINMEASIYAPDSPCKGCCDNEALYKNWKPAKAYDYSEEIPVVLTDLEKTTEIINEIFGIEGTKKDHVSDQSAAILSSRLFTPTDPEKLKKAINDVATLNYSFASPLDLKYNTKQERDISEIKEEVTGHLSKRVEDIQANVLEYGNNAISKLIGLNDKLNALYIDLDKEIQSIDARIDCIESMLKDIQKTLNDQPVIGDIHRVESKLDGLDIKQVVVDEVPVINESLFKVGDCVVDHNDVVWIIDEVLPEYYVPGGYTYYECTMVKNPDISSRFQQHQLHLCSTAKKLPKQHKFKVGGIVKYKTGKISYIVIKVKRCKTGYIYDLKRQFYDKPHTRDYKVSGVLESKLEEVK